MVARVRRRHFGIATLIAPHLAVVGGETCFVHAAFAHHDVWPAEDRGRVAQAVRVVDRDGRATTVAHFHGVRMAAGKGDTAPRRRQAERVAALVERVRRPGDVVVVAGDVNVLPGSEAFEVLAQPEVSDHRPLVLDMRAAHGAGA